jgi:hypothetical protein
MTNKKVLKIIFALSVGIFLFSFIKGPLGTALYYPVEFNELAALIHLPIIRLFHLTISDELQINFIWGISSSLTFGLLSLCIFYVINWIKKD